ncbi:WXG100 family type VII secretion target [Kitasatospora sp. NPDC092286]|uniref:WXG100 family type VII secretion target n=1 Tax=Kitasatospora sp. NPDC092286 TaxID=3364087 RepID=UPI0037F7DAF2
MNYTDFGAYSHGQLRKMAEALNPGEVMAASDPWRRAADTLKAIRTTLTRASTEAAVSWEGSTSDAFHTRMLQLAATINNTAAYANDAAITLKAMSEAIAKAKRDMPEEPSGWDQFKDGVGDTVSSLFGGDDEDTKTAVVEQKKAEAVAVMQTLAMHYRVATPMLKPPPPPPPPGKRGDNRDPVSQDDPTGSAAVGAMIAGTAMGSTGTPSSVTNSPAPQRRKPPDQLAAKRPAASAAAAPTDSGIKGGAARTLPKSPGTTNIGPGVGIDGTNASIPGRSGSGLPASGTQISGNGFSNPAGPAGGSTGGGPGGGTFGSAGGTVVGIPGGPGGQNKAGAPGGEPPGRENLPGRSAVRGGQAFGAGEVYEGGYGAGGRGAPRLRDGSGPAGRTGGVIGEGGRPSVGSGGRQAFTEGGSGLGARNRVRGELGAGTGGGLAPGMPFGDAQRRKKDNGKDGKRPDYLVEDEETWASDKPTNPNVVE